MVCSKPSWFSYLRWFCSFFAVGYDDRRMVLDGEFSYENENQRALPFSVKIQEISEAMRVHTGSTSKTHPADG